MALWFRMQGLGSRICLLGILRSRLGSRGLKLSLFKAPGMIRRVKGKKCLSEHQGESLEFGAEGFGRRDFGFKRLGFEV